MILRVKSSPEIGGPGIAAVTRLGGGPRPAGAVWGAPARQQTAAGLTGLHTSGSRATVTVDALFPWRAISDAPIPGALRASHPILFTWLHDLFHADHYVFLSTFLHRRRSLLTRISFRTFLNIRTPFQKSSLWREVGEVIHEILSTGKYSSGSQYWTSVRIVENSKMLKIFFLKAGFKFNSFKF